MFCLGVRDHVMIAHSFGDPFFGPAQRVHGATYTVVTEVRSPSLGRHHVVMDIGALRRVVRAVLDDLDYRNLDDHAAFPGRSSTTERVAEHVANRVAAALAALEGDERPPPGGSLRVTVDESPVAYAAFERPL